MLVEDFLYGFSYLKVQCVNKAVRWIIVDICTLILNAPDINRKGYIHNQCDRIQHIIEIINFYI